MGHPTPRSIAAVGVPVAGFVRHVEECYRSAAMHILPSECEGSAKCTCEAAACGLPQITTRESGDVVQHEVNGLIVPPDDPDALAAAIERLYRDRHLGARLGAAGRQRVVENNGLSRGALWGRSSAPAGSPRPISLRDVSLDEVTSGSSSRRDAATSARDGRAPRTLCRAA